MNEEAFNLSVRKFLKHFGVTAQREIEKSVDAALSPGKLKGTETLKARARLEIQGLPTNLAIQQDTTLAQRRHASTPAPRGGSPPRRPPATPTRGPTHRPSGFRRRPPPPAPVRRDP